MNIAYARRMLLVCGLDPALLGEPISAGRQHHIFHYGPTQTVKIPRRSLYMRLYGAIPSQAVTRDVHLLQTHLGPYTVPTTVYPGKSGRSYVVLQEFLGGAQFLTGINFPDVREDFASIAAVNRTVLRQHNLSIDFFGNLGFKQSLPAALLGQPQRALLNNLMVAQVDGRPRIRIVDVNLSELKRKTQDVRLFHWLVDRGLFLLTRWMIRRLFAIDT